MTEHTPIPWAVHIEGGEAYIVEADPRFGTPLRGGRWICHFGSQEKLDGEDQANLDFILRSTYVFSDLLSLVADLVRRVEAKDLTFVDSEGVSKDQIFLERAKTVLAKARYSGVLHPCRFGISDDV